MYVLRIQINDQPPVTGGAEDLGVLSTLLTGTGKLGSRTQPVREDESVDFHLSLRGLTSRAHGATDEHLEWVSHRTLKVGDKVVVEVLESEVADAIVGRNAAERGQDERVYFEQCKEVYLELRDRYEGPSSVASLSVPPDELQR